MMTQMKFQRQKKMKDDGEHVSMYGIQCEDCGCIPANSMTGRCESCEKDYLKERGLDT